MIEILEEYLQQPTKLEGCVVNGWLLGKPEEVQYLFKQLMEKRGVNVASLYSSLEKSEKLPFKLTAFRMHMRGYCTCPKI